MRIRIDRLEVRVPRPGDGTRAQDLAHAFRHALERAAATSGRREPAEEKRGGHVDAAAGH